LKLATKQGQGASEDDINQTNHPSPITHHPSPITNHKSPITNREPLRLLPPPWPPPSFTFAIAFFSAELQKPSDGTMRVWNLNLNRFSLNPQMELCMSNMLQKWKERGGPLAAEDIARVLSHAAAGLQ
jgi:hypothetical protein